MHQTVGISYLCSMEWYYSFGIMPLFWTNDAAKHRQIITSPPIMLNCWLNAIFIHSFGRSPSDKHYSFIYTKINFGLMTLSNHAFFQSSKVPSLCCCPRCHLFDFLIETSQRTYIQMPKSAANNLSYLPNPSARAGYDARSIFKRSLTGLNSEFYYS